MKSKITISLDQEIIQFIFERNKDKPLSTFVNEVLQSWKDYVISEESQMKGGID